MTDQAIDRTKQPVRRPPFSGAANQTLDGSQPDWGLIGHAEPPDGAPNVLVVLIDGIGFGAVDAALANAIKTPVAQIEGLSAKNLKAGLAEAQAGEMAVDPAA
jgi:hypothetical protein